MRIELGTRFNRLIITGFNQRTDVNGQVRKLAFCKCDCGNEKLVLIYNLKNGNTNSCGCYGKDRTSTATSTHGQSKTSTWQTWSSMRQRCLDSKCKRYSDYGGRGIKICKRWNKFENFLADMGERPPNMSLDRINNNGGYSPQNCRWATLQEQANNTRKNHWIVFQGVKYTIAQLARHLSVPVHNVDNWVRRGKLERLAARCLIVYCFLMPTFALGETFSWINPTTDANGGQLDDLKETCLRRSPTQGDYSGDILEQCVPAPETTMSFATMPGFNYFVAVAKDNAGNVSANSNEVSINDCTGALELMTIDRDRWKREVTTARINRNQSNEQLKKCILEKIRCGCK